MNIKPFLLWLYGNSVVLSVVFVLGLGIYLITAQKERHQLEMLEAFANKGERFTFGQGCELERRIELLYISVDLPYKRVLPRKHCNGAK